METPLQETMEALMALKDEGKIQHIGVCNYNSEGMLGLMKHGEIESFQTPLSMVRSRYDRNLKDLCESGGGSQHPIGVIGYEPLCRGLLSGKYRGIVSFPPGDVRGQDDWFKGARFFQVLGLVRLLDQIGIKVKSPLAALAIAWSANQPGVVTSIVGAKKPEQIKENARASDLLQRPKLMSVLNRIVADYPPI
jgi:aryl-alcohol dehydrogenase-like predicted oxidoreductase